MLFISGHWTAVELGAEGLSAQTCSHLSSLFKESSPAHLARCTTSLFHKVEIFLWRNLADPEEVNCSFCVLLKPNCQSRRGGTMATIQWLLMALALALIASVDEARGCKSGSSPPKARQTEVSRPKRISSEFSINDIDVAKAGQIYLHIQPIKGPHI